MIVIANFQDDRYNFIDKLSGRHIKILRNNKNLKQAYNKAFKHIKRKQIITHNTHLVDYCETN